MLAVNGVLGGESTSRVRDFLGEQLGTAATVDLLVEPAKYSYAHLSGLLSNALREVPAGDLAEAFVDQRANRVVVRLASAAALASFRDRIVKLPLGGEALSMEIGSMVALDADSLRSRVRPTIGGLYFWNKHFTIGGGCTMGCNACDGNNPGGPRYFGTASHCGDRFGLMTSAPFSQPFFASARIGVEILNPPPFAGFGSDNCNVGMYWRYSDALIGQYDDSVSSQFGVVARTPGYFNYRISGTTSIVSTVRGAVVGSHVIKIGGYTAETAGTVLTVCSSFDVNYQDVGWVRILCTMTASYVAGSGDSGGPVFEQWEAGDPAIPVGIHIGRSSSPAKSWISPLNGINADFGWNWMFH